MRKRIASGRPLCQLLGLLYVSMASPPPHPLAIPWISRPGGGVLPGLSGLPRLRGPPSAGSSFHGLPKFAPGCKAFRDALRDDWTQQRFLRCLPADPGLEALLRWEVQALVVFLNGPNSPPHAPHPPTALKVHFSPPPFPRVPSFCRSYHVGFLWAEKNLPIWAIFSRQNHASLCHPLLPPVSDNFMDTPQSLQNKIVSWNPTTLDPGQKTLFSHLTTQGLKNCQRKPSFRAGLFRGSQAIS